VISKNGAEKMSKKWVTSESHIIRGMNQQDDDRPISTSTISPDLYYLTMATTASALKSHTIHKVYRELARLIKLTPDATKSQKMLQTDFRKPLGPEGSVEQRLEVAEQKLSFLRMTTVKTRPSGQSGRWIYKDGEKLQSDAGGTIRDSKGRVVSNYDGANMDPEMVTRHRKSLKRAGFVNNEHAKGVF
jgi:hypothetical protein